MRLIVAVALLILGLTSPAQALSASDVESMARSVGCTAPVKEIHDEKYPFNAFYAVGYEGETMIGLINFDVLPDSWAKYIAWHEIGHCLQHQNGAFNGRPAATITDVEWDADDFAIRQMALVERVDATSFMEEMFQYLYNKYGYLGDHEGDPHGFVVDRLTHARQHRVLVPTQS